MNVNPNRITLIVVWTISILSLIGVSSLCGTLFYKNYADPAVLTAIISLTSGLVGALGAILTLPRSTTKPTDEPPPPPPPPAAPPPA